MGGPRKKLERLNELAWQAGENTIFSWTTTEGYPVDGEVSADGIYTKLDIPEHTEYGTQPLDKYALSIFYRALKFAEEQRAPIFMDD